MLASGTVFANIVLLRGVDIALLVDTVYPQLLVYDGPVPDDESVRAEVFLEEDDDNNLPDRMPLPNPLPMLLLIPGRDSGSIRSAFR
jgi:hypothetical protein